MAYITRNPAKLAAGLRAAAEEIRKELLALVPQGFTTCNAVHGHLNRIAEAIEQDRPDQLPEYLRRILGEW